MHADTLWNKTSLLKSRWWVRGRLQQTLALLLLLLLFLCYKVGGFYATEMFTGEVKILNIQSVKLKQRSLSTSGSRTGAEGGWSARWTAIVGEAFRFISLCSDPHLRLWVLSSNLKKSTVDTRGWDKFPGAGSRATAPPCREDPAVVVQASVLWARPTGRRLLGQNQN